MFPLCLKQKFSFSIGNWLNFPGAKEVFLLSCQKRLKEGDTNSTSLTSLCVFRQKEQNLQTEDLNSKIIFSLPWHANKMQMSSLHFCSEVFYNTQSYALQFLFSRTDRFQVWCPVLCLSSDYDECFERYENFIHKSKRAMKCEGLY